MPIFSENAGMSPSAAHLLIHAANDVRAQGKNIIARLFLRLRTYCRSGSLPADGKPLRIAIRNVEGLQIFALDDAGTTVDVALPAGTYQMMAFFGRHYRNYTMALQQGQCLSLYLGADSDGEPYCSSSQ